MAVLSVLLVLWLAVVAFRLVTGAADARRGVDAHEPVSQRATGSLSSVVE